MGKLEELAEAEGRAYREYVNAAGREREAKREAWLDALDKIQRSTSGG